MVTYSIPPEILDRSDALAKAGRIIGGLWRRGPPGGAAEMVCALASWEQQGRPINSVNDCPIDYAPRWLLEMIPSLDNGLQDDAARARFVLGLNARARHWDRLDDAAWDRVRVAVLIHCVTDARASAESVCPDPRPAYYDQVHDACGMVLDALRGNGDLTAAEAAAEAAAWAAWAAAEAAVRAAARAAAEAPIKAAAEAAFWAAEAAAWAAWAAARAAVRAAVRAAAWAAVRAAEAAAVPAARAAVRAAAWAAATQRTIDALLLALDAELL